MYECMHTYMLHTCRYGYGMHKCVCMCVYMHQYICMHVSMCAFMHTKCLFPCLWTNMTAHSTHDPHSHYAAWTIWIQHSCICVPTYYCHIWATTVPLQCHINGTNPNYSMYMHECICNIWTHCQQLHNEDCCMQKMMMPTLMMMMQCYFSCVGHWPIQPKTLACITV